MRYNKEGLDAAYAKISIIADPVWTPNVTDPYVQANKELWKQIYTSQVCSGDFTRRSVMDTIPSSRLADYGAYLSDERLECAFEPSSKQAAIAQPNREKISTSYVNQEFHNQDLFQSQEIERLFEMLSDTETNNEEIEANCQIFLQDLEMKKLKPNTYTLTRKLDSLTSMDTASNCSGSDSEVFYDTKDRLALLKLEVPQQEKRTLDELKLQMRIRSREVRALWDTMKDKELKERASKFLSKPFLDEVEDPFKMFNHEVVPNLQPWLCFGYPLRHSDFGALATLSSDMEALRHAAKRSPPQLTARQPMLAPRSNQSNAPVAPKDTSATVAPPAKRLYSAVLQNQPAPVPISSVPVSISQLGALPRAASSPPGAQRTATSGAPTGMNSDELDELEREAIEQYRPSNESLGKMSEDSIISAKFQELERLALEQYNSAAEASADPVGGSTSGDSMGNVPSPPQEPPCGGKPAPQAALLLNWNMLVALYRSRLLACLGAGQRFR